jgi:hypothetical protein
MEASAIKHYIDFVTKLLTVCICFSGQKILLCTNLEFFLWELISRQPLISRQARAKHGEASHLVLFLEAIVNFLLTQLIVQLLTI